MEALAAIADTIAANINLPLVAFIFLPALSVSWNILRYAHGATTPYAACYALGAMQYWMLLPTFWMFLLPANILTKLRVFKRLPNGACTLLDSERGCAFPVRPPLAC